MEANEMETLVFDELQHTTYHDTNEENPKAYLCVFDLQKVWFPASVCDDVNEDQNTIRVKKWFIKKEGLEVYIDE